MAVFKAGYNNNGISGKLGNTVFFLDKDKQQAAREYVANPENPRTPTQQLNRVKTIGVARLARRIYIERKREWNLIKTAKGSYYNSIFKNLRANPLIDFLFVGASFGWAYTEYRTDPLSLCRSPSILWNGTSGICEFEIFTAQIFLQDPLNNRWFIGVSFRIAAEINTVPEYDSQTLFITVFSANWGTTYVQRFDFSREEARKIQNDYITWFVEIDPVVNDDVFAYSIGFEDRLNTRRTKRNITTSYIQGYTQYNGVSEQFISTNFSFSEKYG